LAKRLVPSNTVVIGGRDEAKLEGARAELPSLRTVTLAVTSEDDARDAIAMIHEQLGGLDILVNSAGVMYGYALTDSDAENA
jgi:short-subunit dehydrogenase involved in D-alanine esterification of teichoic acids